MAGKWFAILCVSLFAVTAAANVQDPLGLLVLEAEAYDVQVVQDANSNWYEIADANAGDASGGVAMASTDSGIRFDEDGYIDNGVVSPSLDYEVEFVKSGIHYVWLRMRYSAGDADTAHIGIDGMSNDGARRIDAPGSADTRSGGTWQWSNISQFGGDHAAEIDIPSAGLHTVNLYVREDGIQVDKIVLTTDPNYVPTGHGPGSPLLIDPNETLVATGDKGMILSIDGMDPNDLILGTTTFAGDPKWSDQPPEDADNFDLDSDASADDQAYVQTLFDLPVTKIYLVEKGGADSGFIVPLDMSGTPMDIANPFGPANFGKPGYKAFGNQDAALTIITPATQIWGIRILPPADGALGIDPVSVSAIAGTVLSVQPIDSVDYLSAADLDPDNGDPNVMVEVLGINGNDIDGLVLGTTTADLQKHAAYLTTDGDDFDLTTKASHDDATLVETLFSVPVTQIFIMEVGANDKGLFQPLDVNGMPIGAPLAFVKQDSQFQDEGLKIMGQKAGGIAITSLIPLGGLQILPPVDGKTGIDPATICGLPVPLITKAPLDTLVADANAIVQSINGYATADLVQGSTIANSDPNRADNADNWDLSETDASRQDGRWITTTFDVPVTQFFVIEKPNGSSVPDDDGWVLPLDIDGNRIGGPLWYQPADWSTFDIPNAKDGRSPAGQAFTPVTDVPVYGLLQWSDGVDVLCIAAVPAQ